MYRKGQTSPEIQLRSSNITKSIIEKTKIIKQATGQFPPPSYLPLNKEAIKINVGDVHAWESQDLNITRYAFNTANTAKNKPHLNDLKKSVLDFNQKLTELRKSEILKLKKCSSYKSRDQLNEEIRLLKSKVEDLDRTVVEVFRAYNQLRAYIVDHKFDNQKYYELLRQQTQTKNNKLRTVK